MLARTGMAWWLILIRAGPSEPTGFESVIAWRASSQHRKEMCASDSGQGWAVLLQPVAGTRSH